MDNSAPTRIDNGPPDRPKQTGAPEPPSSSQPTIQDAREPSPGLPSKSPAQPAANNSPTLVTSPDLTPADRTLVNDTSEGSATNVPFSWDPEAEPSARGASSSGAPHVDGYELLGELGRGGMGVVYRALHRGLKREVALKMLLGGTHSSLEQYTRFRAEAEAVARLEHPHIVRIYDVGEQDGLPYFSLEYIEGGTLDKLLTGKPQAPDDAAKMTARLALAMQYAHERGIVHRDLKPANVLLTRDGDPRITDFGLVKRLEGEDHGTTRTGAIMGTPGYMAPEQARAEKEVGPAADIYALGATLYAMLTGRPPFLAANPFDTIVQVLDDEPVPPRQLQPKLNVDLDTICLKCLQKDPARRYATARDLADDLQRYLDGEPILARPVGRLERTWRWCRRRPLIAGLSGVALVLGGIVLVGAPIAAFKIARERDAAVRARDEARLLSRAALEAKSLAERKEHEAESARTEADAQAQAAARQRGLALDALGTLVTRVQNQLRETPATQKLKQELLATGLDGLRKVAESAQRAPGTDALMAEAHQRMGDIFQSLAQNAEARQQYELSHAIRADLASKSPDDGECRAQLALALSKLGDVSFLEGNRAAAAKHYEESLQIRESLARQAATDFAAQVNLATAFVKMGNVSEPEAARRYFGEALVIRKQLAAAVKDATRPNRARDVWITLNKLAELSLKLDDKEAARNFYEQALVQARAIHELMPESVRAKLDLAAAHVQVGRGLDDAGQWELAHGHLDQALQLLRPLAEEDPRNIELQALLALALARRGTRDEAVQRIEQVRNLAPTSHLNLYNVACCYALCAASYETPKRTDPLSEAEQMSRKQLVDQALAALSQAVQQGLRDADGIAADGDLQVLHGHATYEKLLGDLRASK